MGPRLRKGDVGLVVCAAQAGNSGYLIDCSFRSAIAATSISKLVTRL